MTMPKGMYRSTVLALAAVLAQVAWIGAQAAPTVIGTVNVPRKVMANGQPLAAGAYDVRLSSDAVTPVVGQTPEAERWVEFVQANIVKGRELASVLLTAADVKAVAKTGTPPAPGATRVDVLQAGAYVRVWLNHGGKHYLIHLTAAK